MPSFKPKGLWPAAPHTCAKIDIVSGYLYPWFEIFARTKGITEWSILMGALVQANTRTFQTVRRSLRSTKQRES
jgi:hypothetical protein